MVIYKRDVLYVNVNSYLYIFKDKKNIVLTIIKKT